LHNVLRRALLLRKGPDIDAADLFFDVEEPASREQEGPAGRLLQLPAGMTLEQLMHQLERQVVESALRRNGNNKERTARQLGLARSSLFKRLKEWGLAAVDEAPG
jgi:DNA-binding NtrC family response regulator